MRAVGESCESCELQSLLLRSVLSPRDRAEDGDADARSGRGVWGGLANKRLKTPQRFSLSRVFRNCDTEVKTVVLAPTHPYLIPSLPIPFRPKKSVFPSAAPPQRCLPILNHLCIVFLFFLAYITAAPPSQSPKRPGRRRKQGCAAPCSVDGEGGGWSSGLSQAVLPHTNAQSRQLRDPRLILRASTCATATVNCAVRISTSQARSTRSRPTAMTHTTLCLMRRARAVGHWQRHRSSAPPLAPVPPFASLEERRARPMP